MRVNKRTFSDERRNTQSDETTHFVDCLAVSPTCLGDIWYTTVKQGYKQTFTMSLRGTRSNVNQELRAAGNKTVAKLVVCGHLASS